MVFSFLRKKIFEKREVENFAANLDDDLNVSFWKQIGENRMFRIGEFSKITQVSIRMLRYYDEQKLLEPCLIDDSNGYRFYSADQIDQLNRIILLRDMGFGVKEMKEILRSWNPVQLKRNLLEQKKRTEETIQTENHRLRQIQGMLYDLEHQEKKLDIEIIMKQLPMQQVLSLRRVVPNYYCEAQLWAELSRYMKKIKNAESLSCFSIYHDLDYREENVDIEICVVLNHIDVVIDNKELIYRQVDGVDIAACFMIYGPYSNINRAYKEFAHWLESHPEYRMSGENRQICHVAMNNTDNPEEYITELQIPLCLTLT